MAIRELMPGSSGASVSVTSGRNDEVMSGMTRRISPLDDFADFPAVAGADGLL